MKELLSVIPTYLEVSEKFLARFFAETEMDPPDSNFAWAAKAIEQEGKLKDGTVYFKHGYEINFKNREGLGNQHRLWRSGRMERFRCMAALLIRQGKRHQTADTKRYRCRSFAGGRCKEGRFRQKRRPILQTIKA